MEKKNRPISLLPILRKIIKKLIIDAIFYIHLFQNNLIASNQSDLCWMDSTINELLSITNKIYRMFKETTSKETLADFLDLSKTFDRVWRDGLLCEIECCRIFEYLLALITSFLSNRKQRVVLEDKSSQFTAVSAGVSPSSVRCSFMFILMISLIA